MPPDDGQVKTGVPMGHGVVAVAPGIIFTEGLGSCVAITLYDSKKRTGGLAHMMLPDSAEVKGLHTPYGCVDTAVTELIESMREVGSEAQDFVATLTGGARMFDSAGYTELSVGDENIKSARAVLYKRGIPLRGWAVGGNHGRSVVFYLDTGRVVIKGIGMEDREI